MVEKTNIIEDITDELKRILDNKFRYDKIILFGSYSTNTFNSESDIDCIIISKEFRGKDIFEIAKMTQNIEYQLTKKFLKPFDILYYSDEEWNNSHSVPINEAKKYGIVLYSS